MTQENNSKFKIQNSKLDFTPPHPLNTAVLFLVFNRLDTTKQVFEAIRQAKPPRLYIGADGARETKEGEDKKAQAVREYILSNIDWECEVKTLFREQNLGCKFGIIEAIDWFFENEEMGIILEDDCLPNQSFFWFCEEMLEKYSNNTNIAAISGTNINGITNTETDYFYSLMGGNWGWATWKRSWENFLPDIELLITDSNLAKIEKNINHKQLFLAVKSIYENQKKSMDNDAWDFQWLFIRLLNNQFTIVPKMNLISNIGFIADSTHTSDTQSPLSNIKSYSIKWPIKCPMSISVNSEYDQSQSQYFYSSIIDKVVRKSKLILKKNLSTYYKVKFQQLKNKLKIFFLKKDIGKNTYIDKTVHITGWNSISIGENTGISEDTWINVNNRAINHKHIVIGNSCYIGRRNFFSSGLLIEIGDFAMTGIDCKFMGSDHVFSDPMMPYIATGTTNDKIIKIGTNVWFGANVTVIGNISIGHGSIIGAGSLVNKDIPSFSIAVGNPCRVIKRFDFKYNKWIKISDYILEHDVFIPTEENYLKLLRTNSPNVSIPLQACSKRFGDMF